MATRHTDRSNITFSQAEGIDPLPRPLASEELSEDVRNLLWSYIYGELQEASVFRIMDWHIQDPWKSILYDTHIRFMHRPADEFSAELETWVQILKPFFQSADYNRIFDVLQFVLRHNMVPSESFDAIKSILEDGLCAYMLVEDGPTIVPIAIPEQRESIEESFQVLASGPFDGARAHLRESADCISAGDYAGSVRESIHAVESVARRLDEGAKKSLSPALEALSHKGVEIHGAFKSGIENLYGYTNDESGIRHSLIEGKAAKVDVEDAAFLFGACASFAAYLVSKARKAGLLDI